MKDVQPTNNVKQDLLENVILPQQVIKLPLLDLSFSQTGQELCSLIDVHEISEEYTVSVFRLKSKPSKQSAGSIIISACCLFAWFSLPPWR
jgi:hypothetical protein